MFNESNLPVIKTPLGTVFLHNKILYIQFEEDLCSISNMDLNAHFKVIETLCKGKKLPFITSISSETPRLLPQKTRTWVNEKIYQFASCSAIVSDDIRLNFIAKLYFRLSPGRIPVKICESAEKAQKWVSNEHLRSQFQISF
jgi:hypothetical protein